MAKIEDGISGSKEMKTRLGCLFILIFATVPSIIVAGMSNAIMEGTAMPAFALSFVGTVILLCALSILTHRNKGNRW